MKDPHLIIISPYITERSVKLSYGNPRIKEESELERKYTFLVDPTANKLEIKWALETIYNAGKKPSDGISIQSVRTLRVNGKKRRRGKSVGYEPNRKKAIVTLAKGQILEDFGV